MNRVENQSNAMITAYDDEAETCGWFGPEVAFGLAYKYVQPGQSILDGDWPYAKRCPGQVRRLARTGRSQGLAIEETEDDYEGEFPVPLQAPSALCSPVRQPDRDSVNRDRVRPFD